MRSLDARVKCPFLRFSGVGLTEKGLMVLRIAMSSPELLLEAGSIAQKKALEMLFQRQILQYGFFGNFRLSYRSGFSFLPSLQSANDQDRSHAKERAENVQPRLRRAGEKPRQPPRDGQAQRRRLPPVCPERKKMMPRQRTAGRKKRKLLRIVMETQIPMDSICAHICAGSWPRS